jgi:hypothetical protein
LYREPIFSTLKLEIPLTIVERDLDSNNEPMLQEQFIHYLKVEKQYSPHTLQAYQTDLRDLAEYLQSEFENAAV